MANSRARTITIDEIKSWQERAGFNGNEAAAFLEMSPMNFSRIVNAKLPAPVRVARVIHQWLAIDALRTTLQYERAAHLAPQIDIKV
jgi:hypothetical protein